ncbi:MerR family transcriptional regulator [Neobacillus muris]|uniref:MerR family transcriptional regulator n=1 Tax=Neobacillus muris TaxID=2941334 RepID=UPI00203EA393|nr:MerR family transcriptional regulator [Neobacillus muris]
MDQREYYINQFAKRASISVRTLRYYDKRGLLVPSKYDESGYKLYTDEDFTRLQFILSFKFLGFSLNEIQEILSQYSEGIQERLGQQKSMMMGRRIQIDQIIETIEEVEKSLQSGECNYELVTKLIQVTKMDLKPEWVNKYLSKNERQTMREIAKESYSKEALQKLVSRGWTEEDHKQHLNKYQYFRKILTKLVNEGYSPESTTAQELVSYLQEMNKSYSKDDPEIREGMKKSWGKFNSLPDNERPKTYNIPDREREFIIEASKIFYSKKK